MAPQIVDVWLDVGRGGRLFTYVDGKNLGIELGDIVLVQLRGRLMHGLIANKRSQENTPDNLYGPKQEKLSLVNVESIVQRAAVDNSWREWLQVAALRCHTSPFQMIKTALPSGWLNFRKSQKLKQKKYWWIELTTKIIDDPDIAKRHKELKIELLKNGGGAWQKDLLKKGFSLELLKRCLKSELIFRQKRYLVNKNLPLDQEKFRSSLSLEPARQLTKEQQHALETFEHLPSGSAFFLWGVTGSGKTEVYLHMASRELAKSRHCLILAPEIGLIPQLVDRCRNRFGEKVLEYHSGCSEKERIRVWKEVLDSSSPVVVVGTRSAIFLPLNPLGLIVLDEEHDSSYKQEQPMPCYHARDLAIDRVKNSFAKVVLGSATPSLATWKSLKPRGEIAFARLSRRIGDRPLPKVYIIDMRQELAAGNRRLISRALIERFSLLPKKNEQAIVLVPRRGYSSFLSCRSCGEVVQCPNCDVSLTVHQNANESKWLRCHWCDYQTKVGYQCQSCGSNAFKPFGAGTQRVIEHLSNELKDLKFIRFDRDTTGGRDGHRQLLERFASGEADVLIGTQMLSKGIDLPRVTTAVVLAADGLLHRPDLLSAEQSLQLFMQLAGRAGRGEKLGKVFVQTYSPDHPVIRYLVQGSYEKFLVEESAIREKAKLIPYSRACLIRLSSESSSMTATAASALAEYIGLACKSNGWHLVGPAPALIEKVAGKSRWQILLHGPEGSNLPLPKLEELWKCLPNGVNLAINPDPINL